MGLEKPDLPGFSIIIDLECLSILGLHLTSRAVVGEVYKTARYPPIPAAVSELRKFPSVINPHRRSLSFQRCREKSQGLVLFPSILPLSTQANCEEWELL